MCAPPGGQNSFIIMQFSIKKIGLRTHFGSWHPPGENPGSATVIFMYIVRVNPLMSFKFSLMYSLTKIY